MLTLAERLSLAIQKRQVTQADLVRAARVTSASVSNWFTGDTKTLRGATLLRLSAFLRVPPQWLEGTDPNEPDWQAEAPRPLRHDVIPQELSVEDLLDRLAALLVSLPPESTAVVADQLKVFAMHPNSLPMRKALEALLGGAPPMETKMVLRSEQKATT